MSDSNNLIFWNSFANALFFCLYGVKINSKTDTSATLGTQYYEGSQAGTATSNSAVVMSANNTYTLTISATDSRGFVSSYT